MLVLGVWQNNSYIIYLLTCNTYINIYNSYLYMFQIIFHYRFLQDIEYSSLCFAVDSLLLSYFPYSKKKSANSIGLIYNHVFLMLRGSWRDWPPRTSWFLELRKGSSAGVPSIQKQTNPEPTGQTPPLSGLTALTYWTTCHLL